MEKWEYKRIYVGDPMQPYALAQMNAAGQDGWEVIQICEFDAWVKRKIVPDA